MNRVNLFQGYSVTRKKPKRAWSWKPFLGMCVLAGVAAGSAYVEIPVAQAPAPANAPAAPPAAAPAPAISEPVAPVADVAPQNPLWTGMLENPRLSMFSIAKTDTGVSLTLESRRAFAPGQSVLLPRARDAMAALGDVLTPFVSRAQILVESHTDDVPVAKNRKNYPSNWELSAARAFSVIHFLESVGFSKSQLAGVGYGESRPLLPHRDPKGERIPEHQRVNARLTITISLEPTSGGRWALHVTEGES